MTEKVNGMDFKLERLSPELQAQLAPLYETQETADTYLTINQIHQGDACTILPQIAPNSVALSIWSPPYFVGKEYEADLSFVDSKAEKVSGQGTSTLQTSQFSMLVRQVRAGQEVEVSGNLPTILYVRDEPYITTTLFVKYNYEEFGQNNVLRTMTVAALPSGLLQARYNPNAQDTIWLTGRNAPSCGEAFRVRISFDRLKAKTNWRVQTIPLPPVEYSWTE